MKIRQDNYVAAGFGREFLWLDLANTLEWDGYGKLTDHLRDSSWIATILKHWTLAPAATPHASASHSPTSPTYSFSSSPSRLNHSSSTYYVSYLQINAR